MQVHKATLIYPPLPDGERNSPFAIGFGKAVALGICYVGAILREEGWDVELIDCRNYPEMDNDQLVDLILKTKADIYGFSVLTNSIGDTFDITKKMKAKQDCKIVIGGPHVTAVPADTLNSCEALDVGVVGEGEMTVKELFPALLKGEKLDGILGIIFRKGDRTVLTPNREFIKDLDELPLPAWDLLPHIGKNFKPSLFSYRKLPATHIITSRGCTKNCSFCDTSVFGQRYRQYSAERIVKMCLHLRENYGIQHFLFDDDSFIVNKKRIKELCALFKQLPFKISWSCNARVDLVNPEILAIMADAGLWQIAYGVESGDQKILNDMVKHTTTQQISDALKWTHEVGVRNKAFFIVGYPTETVENIESTIKLATSNPIDDFQCSIYSPYPNTLAATLIKGPIDWTKTNMFEATYNINNMTKETVERMHKKAIFKFYIRPKIFWKIFKECFNIHMLKKHLISFHLFCKLFMMSLKPKLKMPRIGPPSDGTIGQRESI